MLKKDEKERFEKIPDDEPIFIVRGQDKLAGGVIRVWATMAMVLGVRSEKYWEARKFADEIERWQQRNQQRIKLPD